MTIEFMTFLGSLARIVVYNPITFVIIIIIFLFIMLGGDYE